MAGSVNIASMTGVPERTATRTCAKEPFATINAVPAAAQVAAIATTVQHADRSNLASL